ncbi:TrbC/VirB2 family protein [Sphingobium scionense]|uniref:TrbC/VirB2 family protein n=1 Tax=Sphingobium scionense TaxID=1404341 RepID=UPI0031B599FA
MPEGRGASRRAALCRFSVPLLLNPLSLLASLLVAEPAFAQANFEGLADNILGLLSNGLLRTLAIIAIIVVGLLWFLGRASVQMLVTVVVGVVIVFSAPWIVDTITG